MPFVVRKCYESWCKYNPNWEIIFLDNQNLKDYLQLYKLVHNKIDLIGKASLSDIIRVNLLNKYGGVWVDSTCFCCQPLDEWLLDKMNSGFLAFSNPGKGRMISSWFLAAKENNGLVKIYSNATNRFWKNNNKLSLWNTNKFLKNFFRKFKIYHYLKDNPSLWHSFIIVKIFKTYHYFWFHYLFAKLYKQSKIFKKIWDNTAKVSADIPHTIWDFGLTKPINEKIKEHIDNQKAPFYKLSWKITNIELMPQSTIYYLLYKPLYIKKNNND